MTNKDYVILLMEAAVAAIEFGTELPVQAAEIKGWIHLLENDCA